MQAVSSENDRLHEQIAEASQSVAQSWPLKTFAYRNPLRGLEHLPFDEAIRQGKKTLGGNGYLANQDYRQLYRDGAITDAAIASALVAIGNSVTPATIAIGDRKISSSEVLRAHLVFGFDSLDPALLDWTLNAGGALHEYRHDLVQELGHGEKPLRADAGASEVSKLWRSTLTAIVRQTESAVLETRPTPSGLPAGRTLSDWLGMLTEVSLVDQINDQMIKWCAVFLDEGMASWGMPGRSTGFYNSWRQLAECDSSIRFLGIKNASKKIRELPESPEAAIESMLNRCGISEQRRTEYLAWQLTHLPGWTGFIRWRGENPGYQAQQDHPVDPIQYLAVRLFYEAELSSVICRREWGIEGTLSAISSHWERNREEYRFRVTRGNKNVAEHDDDAALAVSRDGWRLFHLAQFLRLSAADVASLSPTQTRTLLGWLDAFPSDAHGSVWLAALETSFRDRLIAKLSGGESVGDVQEASTLAQFVFCIDVRSEPMRRNIEARGRYQTFGFAGFFGIPMSYQAFDTDEHAALCPVILSPKFAVNEVARSTEQEPLATYAASSRWTQLGEHLFHDLKRNAFSSLMLIDVVGVFFGALLAGKTFFQRKFDAFTSSVMEWFSRRIATEIPVGQVQTQEPSGSLLLPHGFTIQEQATFVESAMRAIGLTQDFSRFVVICGHGSTSDNNPFFAAYNCGACGGGHGDANARVFAAMSNNPEVRSIIRNNGLAITDETWFLAAKHNTVTDSITFYDTQDIPASHENDLIRMIEDVEKASDSQAQARCTTLPQAPEDLSPQQAREHMLARSVDWANVRPEWGLSGNAAFILGRRALTDNVDLEGRVFLQSYDPATDPHGTTLEALMTAPLVVAQWISMEYYFSAVDPSRYGSGSKVTHNVVAGIGVMHGAHGDLESGLPLQSVNDGTKHYHKPVRLLAVIEAPTSRIESAIGKHVLLQHLLHNQWIHFVAIDPQTKRFQRYTPQASWEPLT